MRRWLSIRLSRCCRRHMDEIEHRLAVVELLAELIPLFDPGAIDDAEASIRASRSGVSADSACRITPVAGWLHSTRAIRLAAAAVPSHTITISACCEKPIPTPPPWCSETHVAPDAVFNNALSSGQSDTASVPSRIASVSRLGEATDPLSR